MDPGRQFLNEVLIGQLNELSVLFERLINTADPTMQNVLFDGLRNDPDLNEYMEVLTKFDTFLA